MADTGRIVLAATPIGDPRDASPRLLELLARADVVAAEDTRRLRRLAAQLEVTLRGQVVAHHEHNEATSAAGLVELARAGAEILYVSDAGMPGVSDPGYRLVRAAIEADVPVTAVPGPSAALAALAVSGLPTDRFTFEGFLPRRTGERARALQALADERRTMVFFEAPHRVATVLAAMRETFGADRRAALCRELTKTYEEVVRGDLDALIVWAAEEVRGEVTLVVAGTRGRAVDAADLVARVQQRRVAGESLKEASRAVAKDVGLGAREVYEAALAAKP